MNNKKIATTKLNNFQIKKQIDKWGKEYFLIINNDDQNEAYFCFQGLVKEGWEILNSNSLPDSIEIEYEENEQNERIYKRVTGIYVDEGILV
jgi:hypothetical protein